MQSNKMTDLPTVANEYNGIDRNAFMFGFNPQAELWNGRLAINWLRVFQQGEFG